MKGRDWSFIAYIDTFTKEQIIDTLEEIGIQCAISPLHDKDIYTQEDYDKWIRKNEKEPEWKIGDYKKPHLHVLVHFNGPTTWNNVKQITDTIGATIPKKVFSNSSYFNYLCHIGEKDKAQYNPKDITILNGYTITLTESEEIALQFEIIEDINKNNIKEYRQIVDLYKDSGDVEKFRLVTKQNQIFSKYLNSKRWEKEEK